MRGGGGGDCRRMPHVTARARAIDAAELGALLGEMGGEYSEEEIGA